MNPKLSEAIQYISNSLDQVIDEVLPPISRDSNNRSSVISLVKPSNDSPDVNGQTMANAGEEKILESMRYSALSGGKRLRPFLLVESAKLFGVGEKSSLYTAAAIELIHTYSLIHDDLPAMDDDALRRGKPSCHVKFGEAAAILAGDGLLTLAFELLADENIHPNSAVRCELISKIAVASGYKGMIAGQIFDIEAKNQEMNIEDILRLQRLKTGELFAVSCEAGAILGKASRNLRKMLHAYAYDVGLAFQITDDLLDAEGSREETGKEVGKDIESGKVTLVSLLGIEEAKERANILVDQAINCLSPFGKKADILCMLARYVIERRK